MGDRANVFMVTEAPDSLGLVRGIYLYTHWRGYRWPEDLREALALPYARNRWSDAQYLTRIIVDQMFADLRDEETGGGISTERGDNGHDIIVVDLAEQQVGFAPEGTEQDPAAWYDMKPFGQFCTEAPAHYPNEDYEEDN